MITSAVRTMGRQLDNLLELSRVGRIVHPSEVFSLSRLCDGVVQRMSGVVDQYQGQVVIDEDMPEVFADPVRIREVFQNLIENALKFASQCGKPSAKISADFWSSAPLTSGRLRVRSMMRSICSSTT